MKLSLFELLYGLSEALDHVESEWHPLPKVHAKKTAYFAVRMGECVGLKKEKLYQLALAGLFHDSGITRSQGGLCREKEGTKEELKFRLLAGEENFMQLPIRNPFSQGKRGRQRRFRKKSRGISAGSRLASSGRAGQPAGGWLG